MDSSPHGRSGSIANRRSHRSDTACADGRCKRTPARSCFLLAAPMSDTLVPTAFCSVGFFDLRPEFYFGRLDIKFESIEHLINGSHFKIVEINGAGAESTHIWDSRMTLREAYRVLFRQIRILFEIGEQNRKRGYNTLGPIRLIKEFVSYRSIQRAYPETS